MKSFQFKDTNILFVDQVNEEIEATSVSVETIIEKEMPKIEPQKELSSDDYYSVDLIGNVIYSWESMNKKMYKLFNDKGFIDDNTIKSFKTRINSQELVESYLKREFEYIYKEYNILRDIRNKIAHLNYTNLDTNEFDIFGYKKVCDDLYRIVESNLD